MLGLSGASAASAATYMRFVEPGWIEANHAEVPLGRGSGRRQLKLLHLSDLHASSVVSLDYLAEAIELGVSQHPDLICLTGDYITTTWKDWADYARLLERLSAAAPTFACLGNHDGGYWAHLHQGYPTTTEVQDLLAQARISLLDNASVGISLAGWNLNLVGVGDLFARQFRPTQAFHGWKPEKDNVTVVLSHNPDSKQLLRPYTWDLMLCGHTHGGQIELPLIGAPFAPIKDMHFIKGLHSWEHRWIHITKGIGNVWGLRFNCRPEISLLSLT